MLTERAAATVVDRLRRRGLVVTTRQVLTFVEALALTGGERLVDVARATLAGSSDDVVLIEAVLGARPGGTVPAPSALAFPQPDEGEHTTAPSSESADTVHPDRASFSELEVLRERDVARCSEAEFALIREMLGRVSLVGERRRTRRLGPPTARRGRFDVRSTSARAVRSDCELIHLARRARRHRARRVVLLIDVSGSMEPYARTLLQLAHVSAVGPGRVEVFALGTRVTRLTRHLEQRDPDAAFDAVFDAARDWGGGTRLGETLRVLNGDPTTRGLLRGATVVMLSDGLDRGDPIELDEQMARLARVAHRIIWVNPLRATDGYAPTAAGMDVALRHVDVFVDGHSLAAMEDLAVLVGGDRVAV